MNRRLEGLAYVGPFLLLYALILVFPLLFGIFLSFHRADLFGARLFVGLENYTKLIADPVFHQAVLNTFVLALLIVPPLTALTLVLALALNSQTRFAAFARGVFFSSSVLSVTIVTLIWRFVLTPEAGLVAKILTPLGIAPPAFLSDTHLTIPSLPIATFWWCFGLLLLLHRPAADAVPRRVAAVSG